MKRLAAVAALLAAVFAALPGSPADAQTKAEGLPKGVKKIEAKFEPAQAKPGQTVTFRLTVELADGFYTYPSAQPDRGAAGMVNQLKFPDPGPVVFVGEVADPPLYETKEEPDLGIKEIRTVPGTAVYERKAVVSPKAAAGAVTVKLAAFRLQVCDKNNCFPARAVPVEAPLTVLPGPAVPVDPMYASEVAKAK